MSSVDFVGITGQGWELPQALDAWSYYTAGRCIPESGATRCLVPVGPVGLVDPP